VPPASSVTAVLAAVAGNATVALLKFIAFALSGSGAMLSEAIHSCADTANQVLLYLGLKRSGKERDRLFQYGYAGERFVFGILSAVGIFFIGCGVTTYHGVRSLLHRHTTEVGFVTFGVLAVSFLLEGAVFVLALRTAWAHKGALPFRRYLRDRADPATMAVLLEDGAAVLGLVLAALGITAAWATGDTRFDAIASILVGLLLGVVALYLIHTNRRLLLGRAVPAELEEKFVKTVLARGSIAEVRDVKTRQLTPEIFQFKAEVRFSEAYVAQLLARALAGQPAARDPATLAPAARVLIQALSEEIDAIEAEVRARIPEARHIDLELEHRPAPAPAASERPGAG
jgi:zinc transporter 9